MSKFEVSGSFAGAAALGTGHIHDTFEIAHETGEGRVRHVLQRLNLGVFPEPEVLMSNWSRVCAHLRESLERDGTDPFRRCLEVVPTRDGRTHWMSESGEVWRCLHFVEDTRSVDVLESATQASRVARAFGEFVCRMTGLGPPPLHEVIPHFHDLQDRYAQLEAAVREDAVDRATSISREIDDAARAREAIETMLPSAELRALPSRIVHNDCKINNVLLDNSSGEALCVIDLDTVMPGRLMTDFGELVRSSCSRAPEDAVDLDAIQIDREWLRAVATGYLEGVAPILEETERAVLPLAGSRMAFENAIRFLTDYLNGDHYFKVHRDGHNRERFHAQMRLMARLDEQRRTLAGWIAA